jgi:hypothetical protein
MSIAPFSARPAPHGDPSEIGQRRARLALLIATVGIAATIMAYAVSPGVRHAVSHAAHSVKNGVTRVVDPDAGKHPLPKHPAKPARSTRQGKATTRHTTSTGSRSSSPSATP